MHSITRFVRFELLLLLTFTIIFCITLTLMRIAFTGSLMYIFLNWNLFLAMIPCFISSYLLHNSININRYVMGLLAATWLLFFPNAPYILTDLFHLNERNGMPKWFDLIMLLSFSWAGLLLGFISLFHIEQLLLKKCSAVKTQVLIITMLFMASFGVYLGRFLRWNSWDIITTPHLILMDIADRFIHPWMHGRTWGVTLLLGTLLTFIYWSIKVMMKNIKT
ncbi:MAG: DUF1361 domain-containing protein [Bacteroidetes bacterium]|nr:DUF1361 domain-containing protein [Bacteroidota bacterium]